MKRGMYWLMALVVGVCLLGRLPAARASLILGTGTASLIGGDLTDPENDGFADVNVNYNATFRASAEPGFGGGEFAFNVFDNIAQGGGNAKWCCNQPTQWVDAEFPQPVRLTYFTITSANDVPNRDPQTWQIQGSNDGTTFTNIFTHVGSNVFTARDQTILFDAGNYAGRGNASSDFALPASYKFIRFQVTGFGGDSAGFQLGELEFFGQNQASFSEVYSAPVLPGIVTPSSMVQGSIRVDKDVLNATGKTWNGYHISLDVLSDGNFVPSDAMDGVSFDDASSFAAWSAGVTLTLNGVDQGPAGGTWDVMRMNSPTDQLWFTFTGFQVLSGDTLGLSFDMANAGETWRLGQVAAPAPEPATAGLCFMALGLLTRRVGRRRAA